MMNAWEYNVVEKRDVGDASKSPTLTKVELDTIGAEGWELVGVLRSSPGRGAVLTYIFKRPIPVKSAASASPQA